MNLRMSQWSLHRRLMVLGMVPAAVMFLVLLFFLTSARINDARTDLYQTAQLLADSLAPATEYAVVSGNRAAIESLLEITLDRANLARIVVSDVSGETIGEVSDPKLLAHEEALRTFSADIIQAPLDLPGSEQTGWFQPDFGLGTGSALKVGTVKVTLSERVLAAKRWTIIWTSAILGGSLLLITSLFANRFAYQLGAPIRRLAGRVEKIGAGEYQIEREPIRAARELDTLQTAILRMAAQLREAEAQQRESLEQMASARDKAESSSLAKSEFLAMMSHELRTPLNGVLGMLDLIDEMALPADQEDFLRTARHSTEDLLTIITDLLDFSRIERGRLTIQHKPFALQPLVENCAASFRHEAESKGLDYELRLRGPWSPLPQVYGDPIRLRQVLAHLIENAIKFTDEGQILVTAQWTPHSRTEGFLSCEIQDSGAGIPGEQIPEMFSSFEQLDRSATRRFGGTGLGLPLVQRLVELMGGHVAVDSAPACGSTFRFMIPVELVGETDIPPAEGEVQSIAAESTRHRALVVEDNQVNQRVARRMLESLGFKVDCAENGMLALEVLQQTEGSGKRAPYDVILMDCQMPTMDGWEATRRIRLWERERTHAPIPIIAMTAAVLDGTEASCRAAGMDDYLAKPVRRDNIRTTLKRWLPL